MRLLLFKTLRECGCCCLKKLHMIYNFLNKKVINIYHTFLFLILVINALKNAHHHESILTNNGLNIWKDKSITSTG